MSTIGSAQSICQDTYAPRTERHSPTEISTPPHGPTTASSTAPIEFSGSAASSSWLSTPYDRVDTATNSASTDRKPMMVALPTSLRTRACLEYTDAPSMPMNTHTVYSMMPLSCSPNGRLEPQKSRVKRSQEKPRNATSTMKATMGTSLATVVTAFITAACRRPRVSPKKMSQLNAETDTASTHRLEKAGK